MNSAPRRARRNLCILSLLILALPAPRGPALAQEAAPTREQIDAGREVYDEFCAICHGRDMIGPGGPAGDLRKFPKDAEARFRAAVLDGKGPAMPPWRGRLTDDDIGLLWAYVRAGP